jgi:cysteine desulfurase family protein
MPPAIYLDNAATSWPKPESVYLAVDHALRESGGNPGRSGHKLSLAAHRIVEETRRLLAQLFGISGPERIVFTMNTTDSLNMALKGLLSAGDHVITGAMEHNSVTRPLEALKKIGVECTKVETSPITGVNIEKVKTAIKKNTKLMVFSHISNVSGTVNPVCEMGALCRERGVVFLVDAAQSAGAVSIDVDKMNIDLLAFPGHKGLLGPQGTGGLYIREGISLVPLRQGGTGNQSELLIQPEQSPFKYESGTLNTPGLAGLGAGVRYILQEGVGAIQSKETYLANKLIEGISQISGIAVYGPPAGPGRSGVASLRFDEIDPDDAAMILDNTFNIAVRGGLHCAPDAHAALGTLDRGGTVRISIGSLNTDNDIDMCIQALVSIASEG